MGPVPRPVCRKRHRCRYLASTKYLESKSKGLRSRRAASQSDIEPIGKDAGGFITAVLVCVFQDHDGISPFFPFFGRKRILGRLGDPQSILGIEKPCSSAWRWQVRPRSNPLEIHREHGSRRVPRLAFEISFREWSDRKSLELSEALLV